MKFKMISSMEGFELTTCESKNLERIKKNKLLMPYVIITNTDDNIGLGEYGEYDFDFFDDDKIIKQELMTYSDGSTWVVLYSSREQVMGNDLKSVRLFKISFKSICDKIKKYGKLAGVIINPYTDKIKYTREDILKMEV